MILNKLIIAALNSDVANKKLSRQQTQLAFLSCAFLASLLSNKISVFMIQYNLLNLYLYYLILNLLSVPQIFNSVFGIQQ